MPDYAITPIRLTAELDSIITTVSKKLGKSKQETMRLCMELGAKWIEANGFDPSREIAQISIVEELTKVITVASEQLDRRDQKLAEVTNELTRLTKKLGGK